MPISNNNAALKIDRARNLGWSPALPQRFGPGRWLRLSKRERRVIRANLRRLQNNNAWRPVVAAGEGVRS